MPDTVPAPKHCKLPMLAYTSLYGEPRWRCAVCPRNEPRAINPICDFCSATPVVANEEARDFDSNLAPWGSVGAWGACQDCHDLVVAQDWDGLERRGVASMLQRFPNSSRKDIKFAVQSMQRQFRIHAG